jgi:hypothetical protein
MIDINSILIFNIYKKCKTKKKKINFTIKTKLKDKFVKHIELVGYDPKIN